MSWSSKYSESAFDENRSSPSALVTTPATETESGEETRTCGNNPAHTETRPIPPTGTEEPIEVFPKQEFFQGKDEVRDWMPTGN